MEPGILDLTIYKGTDFTEPYFQLKDSAGDPIPLTGHSASLVARVTPESTEKIIDLTDANDGLVFTEATGIITPNLPKADIEDIAEGVYDYALYVKDAGGITKAWLIGKISVVETAGEIT